MAVKSSLTFVDVLAEVSKNSNPASRAYASASAVSIARLSGWSLTRSALFPASAMMMFSFACRCSSFTHDFALSKDDLPHVNSCSLPSYVDETYCLSDIIDDHCAIGVSVVHRGQRLISLLACCVPYLELYGCVLVKRYGLCEESGADCRFAIVVELIFHKA